MSISLEYYSFNAKRADERWGNFPDDLAKTKAGEKIESGWRGPLEDLTYEEETRDENTVLNNLKFLDLFYGSVYTNPTPESGKQEYFAHKALIEAANLQHEPDHQPKEDWIKVYSQIDNDFINIATILLAKENGWEHEEGREILLDFLHNVRPVVKDLKENEDSIFITDWDTGWEVLPDSAENFLMQRAKNHLEDFRDLI